MKLLRWVFFLLLSGCAAVPHGPMGTLTITGQIVVVKKLRDFHDATAMSIDQFRNVFIVESAGNVVIKISPNGDSLRVASGFGADHYQFNAPSDVDAHLTNSVFISDRFNHRIEQYTKDLAYVSTLYTRDNTDAGTRFGYPAAVAVDDAGNIYLADGENKRVLKARSDFSVERTIGGYSEAVRPDAVLSNPIDLAIADNQHLVVLDNGGRSLVEFDNLGNLLARTPLASPVRSIAASHDTVFALESDSARVRLFSGRGLVSIGGWILPRTDSDLSQAEDFQVRGGTIYFLTREALYSCRLARPSEQEPSSPSGSAN